MSPVPRVRITVSESSLDDRKTVKLSFNCCFYCFLHDLTLSYLFMFFYESYLTDIYPKNQA